MTGEAGRRPGIPRRERGAITAADRVVTKIASQVADEALSRFTESGGHVPPGRRMPRATASLRRAPEPAAARGDGESAAGRQAGVGEVRMRVAVELGCPSDIGAQLRRSAPGGCRTSQDLGRHGGVRRSGVGRAAALGARAAHGPAEGEMNAQAAVDR